MCGSSSRCRGVVCSLWLWYFLIILFSSKDNYSNKLHFWRHTKLEVTRVFFNCCIWYCNYWGLVKQEYELKIAGSEHKLKNTNCGSLKRFFLIFFSYPHYTGIRVLLIFPLFLEETKIFLSIGIKKNNNYRDKWVQVLLARGTLATVPVQSLKTCVKRPLSKRHLLLNYSSKFKISLQNVPQNCSLLKLPKQSRYAEQDGHKSSS